MFGPVRIPVSNLELPAAVFLSHRHHDSMEAKHVFDRLFKHGVPAYLDDVDPLLGADSETLTEQLRLRLEACTHLMAVVSENTEGSWWVPFEIGLATEKNYPIATYLLQEVKTPEYLKKWPYLRSDADLDAYAKELRGRPALFRGPQLGRIERVREVHEFHRRLKARLGQ